MSNRYSNSIPLAILEQLERYGDHDDIMETPMNDALHREAIDRLKRGRACLCCGATIDTWIKGLCPACIDALSRCVETVGWRPGEQALWFDIAIDQQITDGRRAVADVTE